MPEYTPDQDQTRKNLRRYAAQRGAQTVPNEVYKKALDDGLITVNELEEWNMSTDRIQLITNGSVPPPSIRECMDEAAENFDPKATEDDGSCIYKSDGEDDDDDIEPKAEPFEGRTLQQLENDVRKGNLTEKEVRDKLNLSKKDWENIRRHYNENQIPAWKDIPLLVAKKTDLWVFGIPGSGKTAMLSAVLGRLNEMSALSAVGEEFEELHEDGYNYRNYLENAYQLNMFPEPTQAEGFNYVPMDMETDEEFRPANLIEMAGEKVRGLLVQRNSKDPNSLNSLDWLKSNNSKVITIVLDINSKDLKQNNELSIVLGMLKKKGVLKKTTKIILLATKVDTLPCFNGTHTPELDAEIEKRVAKNFSTLRKQVKRLSKKNFWGRAKLSATLVPFTVGSDIVKGKYLRGERHVEYVDLYIKELMQAIDIRKNRS